jgi:hypothetical protein
MRTVGQSALMHKHAVGGSLPGLGILPRRGRGWVLVGGAYSTQRQPGSLDEYLKTFLKRATAGWVAVLLERAGVLMIDRSQPIRVTLSSGW